MSSTASTVVIRRAGFGDARLLASLGARTFLDTYTGLVPDAELRAYVADVFTPDRLRAELDDPHTTVFVALRIRQPVGYALVRREPAPHGVGGTSPLSLGRIYVDATAQGSGTGSALFTHVLAEAACRAHDRLWLTVWEHNTRAIAVYERWGFSDVGAVHFDFAGVGQTDRVMATSVPQLG
ncbi:MAG TPA: GNAT family N-acetyltransferase [Acidimicrobiia bacterium]|nr:GNAT family N-acetyltransferase [Acidimicrobiia bacterium]